MGNYAYIACRRIRVHVYDEVGVNRLHWLHAL